ncbi:MAG TPA: hypothetical protein PK156_14460 [Polyangium sp.]|nr:hypothetical protein [Polyangium sp.]
MTARIFFAIVTIVVVLACGSLGLAGESARVLIIASSSRDATALRLRDELAVLGFDVVVVDSASASKNLAEAARSARAAAGARVETWPPEILLWVADDAKSADDTLRVSQSLQGKVESEMLALRAVELLRGKLLPVPSPPGSNSAAPNPSSPADEPLLPMVDPGAPAMVGSLRSLDGLVLREKPAYTLPPATVRQEKASFMISLGTVVSPGGMSALFHGALGGRFPLRRRWSIETWLFAPITAGLVENADGQIATRPFFLGGGLEYRLTSLDNPWSVFLGAGLGPLLIHFEGTTSNAAYVGALGTQWTGFAYGHVGGAIRLHPKFRLRFDGFVGPVFPEPVLRIAGREVAHVGRPAVFLTLGMEVNP